MSNPTDDGRIYRQHEAAFNSVSAYVITNSKGERVATVAFKFGARVTCFFHVLGTPMVKAFAAGGGYDRASAAAHKAVRRAVMRKQHDREPETEYHAEIDNFTKLVGAIEDEGQSWDGDLRDAGFNVLQAV